MIQDKLKPLCSPQGDLWIIATSAFIKFMLKYIVCVRWDLSEQTI